MIRISRAIIAVLIGLSVATLPATAGFAAVGKAMQAEASQAMPDCDHHHAAPSNMPQNTSDNGACMAACALSCFNFTSVGDFAIAFSAPAKTALKPARTHDHVASQMGNPPFRPPRS